MEDNIEPHEELAELLNGEPSEDLNDSPVDEPAETKGETPEDEPAKAEAPESEPVKQEEVPPTSNDDARFQAMLAKSQDEVSKRQAAETRRVNAENEAQQLRQQLEQMQRQPQQLIDPLDNPEGYRQQLLEAQNQQLQSDQMARMRDKITMSEMVVKTSVGAEKYDEATQAFAEAAKSNTALVDAMYQSDIPAKYAYDEGQRILFMQKIGNDPEAYETNIREQVRKEIEAEMVTKAQAAQRQQTIEGLPQTIANAGTAAPASAELPDDDLETLLNQ